MLYLFLETVELDRSRDLFERVLRFPLIEVEPHAPHHKHGVVKYDAGGLILSLNLTDWSKFGDGASDGLVTKIAVPAATRGSIATDAGAFLTPVTGDTFSDPHGHLFELQDAIGRPSIPELRLATPELATAIAFYRDVLLLPLQQVGGRLARFSAGAVDLVLEERDTAVDGLALQLKSYLPVFYTPDIVATQAALIARGVLFRRPRPGFSEIGGSSRFEDPSGHTLCLYEPSAECLTWGSGPKVIELTGAKGGPRADRFPHRLSVSVRQ